MSGGSIPTILIVGPILLGLVGIVLTWLGLRGRTIDNHPICRKCGFDLFGLDQSTRCPECGSELSAQAIRLGHRAVRRWTLAMGLLLLVPALVVLAAVGVAVGRGADLQAYKPVWWLLREDDAPAVTELNRRLSINVLSDGQINSIVEAGLRDQANANIPWLPMWGDFIESAHDAGNVSDKQWERYVRAAVELKLTSREKIRRGDMVPIRIGYEKARIGTRPQSVYVLNVKKATVDGQPMISQFIINPSVGLALPVRNGPGPGLGEPILFAPGALSHLSDGPHTLSIEVGVYVRSPVRAQSTDSMTRWTTTLTSPLELVAPDAPTVELIAADSALRRKIQSSLAVHATGTGIAAAVFLIGGAGMQINVDAINPPMDLSFDLILRDASGREWPVLPIYFRAHERRSWQQYARPNGFESDFVDVILRSSPRAAMATVDMTRIWSGEVVFPHRLVEWHLGTTRPAKFEAGIEPTTKPATRPTP